MLSCILNKYKLESIGSIVLKLPPNCLLGKLAKMSFLLPIQKGLEADF